MTPASLCIVREPPQDDIRELQDEVQALRKDVTRLCEGLTLALSLLNEARRNAGK